MIIMIIIIVIIYQYEGLLLINSIGQRSFWRLGTSCRGMATLTSQLDQCQAGLDTTLWWSRASSSCWSKTFLMLVWCSLTLTLTHTSVVTGDTSSHPVDSSSLRWSRETLMERRMFRDLAVDLGWCDMETLFIDIHKINIFWEYLNLTAVAFKINLFVK